MQKFTRSLFAVGAVLGLAACGDDVSVTPPAETPAATIASVTVSPAAVTIVIGEKENVDLMAHIPIEANEIEAAMSKGRSGRGR